MFRADAQRRIKHNARSASCSPCTYMFNAQQLTCDRTSHIKVAPDRSARGTDGESTIPRRLPAIKSRKVFRLRSPVRGGVYRHRFFHQETVLHFFKTAARTTRNYCALTYRAHAPARSIRVHARVCVCRCVCVARICATHIYRVSRGTLRRAMSTFLYGIACEQVRLRNDRGEIIRAPAGFRMRAYVSRNELLWADCFFVVSHVKLPKSGLSTSEIQADVVPVSAIEH